jgi:hypothetical protein
MKEMSDIERRGGSRLTRKQREQRAYRLVLATGAFGLVGTVGLLLAIVGILGGAFWPIVSLIIAAICFVLLRRNLR